MKTIGVLLALLAASSTASQPKFRIFAAEPLDQFMVFGRIVPGFEEELRQAIAEHPRLKRVAIESSGGLMLEAKRTAELLNEHGIAIRVAGKCASACALLWAASDRRELMPKARIGLHAGLPVKRTPEPIENMLSLARHKISNDMLRHAGFSEALIKMGNQVPNDSILWLTPSELSSGGVKFTLVGPAI